MYWCAQPATGDWALGMPTYKMGFGKDSWKILLEQLQWSL